MIICKTPFRISFFGGGTDFPDYYKKFGGSVIGSTIDKYSYIILRDHPNYFEKKHRLVWSLNEDFNKINEIKHPIAKAVFKLMKIKNSMKMMNFIKLLLSMEMRNSIKMSKLTKFLSSIEIMI